MDKDYRITRIGAEPLVVWDRDSEDDLPRPTVIMPGWRLEGSSKDWVEFGEGAAISFTIERFNDEPLVPSDPAPDIEDGFITIGGWTLAELRVVAQNHRLAEAPRWRRFRGWLTKVIGTKRRP